MAQCRPIACSSFVAADFERAAGTYRAAFRRMREYLSSERTWGARHAGVLRPRPVARAAVRANTVGSPNINGGVNRVGIR